jgi:hypothetical protein
MKYHYRLRLSSFLIFFSFISVLYHSELSAQVNLEARLRDILSQKYPESYIQEYMQPFATALGTIVISGIYHRATAKEFPHLDIGFNVVSLKIPGKARTFQYQGNDIPTIFGDEESGTDYPGGTDTDHLSVPQVQLNLGLFSGFEVMLRGNKYEVSEIGKMDFLGVAVKYGLSDIIPVPEAPIGLSVQVIYHTYGISNWLNSGTFAMNFQSSADLRFLPVNIYGGLSYESTSLKISTDKIPGIGEDAIGDISINGKNKLRFTIGTGINLYLFNIHADYNIGEYHSLTAGAMIVF